MGVVSAEGSDSDQYLQYNRYGLDAYTQGLGFDMEFGDLTYEFGLTALIVDAKVLTTDFKKTTFSVTLHVPYDALEKAHGTSRP